MLRLRKCGCCVELQPCLLLLIIIIIVLTFITTPQPVVFPSTSPGSSF